MVRKHTHAHINDKNKRWKLLVGTVFNTVSRGMKYYSSQLLLCAGYNVHTDVTSTQSRTTEWGDTLCQAHLL